MLLGFLVALVPALADITDNSFLADVFRIVQNIMTGEEPQPIAPEEEAFVNPMEVQQVLREMKDMKRELNRLAKEFKKMPNGQDDLNKINELLVHLAAFGNQINQGTALRDVIQDFRDAQIWEELNRFRAKVEIPKETKYWNRDLKRLERMLNQKKYHDLGFDLEATKTKLAEIKATLAKVQEYYNSGDLESAMEEFDDLRQDLHPGEIVGVLQRTQELMSKAKRIKDAEIREQVKEMFGEVVSSFNEGDYRIARELMDENFNQISQIIYRAYSVGKKGYTKEGFFEMTENLEQTLRSKAEEKKVRFQEMRERIEAPQPVIPQTPSSSQITPSAASEQASPVNFEKAPLIQATLSPPAQIPSPMPGGETLTPSGVSRFPE